MAISPSLPHFLFEMGWKLYVQQTDLILPGIGTNTSPKDDELDPCQRILNSTYSLCLSMTSQHVLLKNPFDMALRQIVPAICNK